LVIGVKQLSVIKALCKALGDDPLLHPLATNHLAPICSNQQSSGARLRLQVRQRTVNEVWPASQPIDVTAITLRGGDWR